MIAPGMLVMLKRPRVLCKVVKIDKTPEGLFYYLRMPNGLNKIARFWEIQS